jgi:hypothetical protein
LTNCPALRLPGQRSTACSCAGSITIKVGYTSMGYLARKAAFFSLSVSMLSQTNRPACFFSDASVKTYARKKRQVCHHGAQASTKMGRFFWIAWRSAVA